jgi:hypothetical protein
MRDDEFDIFEEWDSECFLDMVEQARAKEEEADIMGYPSRDPASGYRQGNFVCLAG